MTQGPEPRESATRSVSLANEEGVKQALADTVLGLWEIVNNLTRLQPSRRARYRVKRRLRVGLWLVLLILPLAACQQKWEQPNVRDEEMESAFFAGLDTKELADLPEPSRLRPCCVFGHDIGVQIRSVPMPGYEIQNVLDIDGLGSRDLPAKRRMAARRTAWRTICTRWRSRARWTLESRATPRGGRLPRGSRRS